MPARTTTRALVHCDVIETKTHSMRGSRDRPVAGAQGCGVLACWLVADTILFGHCSSRQSAPNLGSAAAGRPFPEV